MRFGDATHVAIEAGSRWSPQFPIGRASQFTVFTGSRSNATEVFFGVAVNSGGPFGRMRKRDGTGAVHVIADSGQGIAAGGVGAMPPGAFGRIEVASGPTSAETYSIIGG